jgi:hypothetical protein
MSKNSVSSRSMALGVLDREAVEAVSDLADTYAFQVASALPVEDTYSLQQGLAGAFLSFLAEAALLLSNLKS